MLHGLVNTAHLLIKIAHKLFELHSAGVTNNVVSEINGVVGHVQTVVDKHHSDLATEQKEASK